MWNGTMLISSRVEISIKKSIQYKKNSSDIISLVPLLLMTTELQKSRSLSTTNVIELRCKWYNDMDFYFDWFWFEYSLYFVLLSCFLYFVLMLLMRGYWLNCTFNVSKLAISYLHCKLVVWYIWPLFSEHYTKVLPPSTIKSWFFSLTRTTI